MESIPSEYFSYAKLLSEYSLKACEQGFTEANGGNLSIRISQELIITTPTMMSKGDLKSDDMVICNLSGDIIYGSRSPSSELFSHIAIYKMNEDAGAIIHTHPPFVCSYACTGELPEKHLSAESYIWLNSICAIPFIMPGSEDLSREIERQCRDKRVILLRNHGLITWGSNIRDAWWRTEIMERHCKISHLIKVRGDQPKPLTNKELIMLEKYIKK